MSECARDRDIGALISEVRALSKLHENEARRVDGLEVKINDMTDMKIAINTISVSMQHMVEHNKAQDILNEKQNETLENMNQNLHELNAGQRKLHSKVASLEQRVDENEERHVIDTRLIDKETQLSKLKKSAVPLGLGAAGALLVEILKNITEVIKALK